MPVADSPKNFVITGVSGFVAPRHLKAIVDTGNWLVAAVDTHDALGVLDRYSFDAWFFTEVQTLRPPFREAAAWFGCRSGALHSDLLAELLA